MTGIAFSSTFAPVGVSQSYGVVTASWPARKQVARALRLQTIMGCMICLLVSPNISMGDAWVVQPSVRLAGIYDDNFFLVPDDEQPDDVTSARLAGALELARVTETAAIAGLIRVDGNFYFGQEEQQVNRRQLDDQSNQLFDFSAFKKGELSRLGGSLSFRRDTLLRTIRAVEDTDDPTVEPDEDVDPDLVDSNVRRQQIYLGPSYSRYLTERVEVELGYEFGDVSYSDVPAGIGTNIVDFQDHLLGAQLLTQVTERDRLVLVLEGRRIDYDNDRLVHDYDVQTGVEHDFSETAVGRLTVGGRYTEFEGGGRPEGDDTGFVFTLEGVKRTGLTTFSGALERDVNPSASGNAVETDELTFNVARQLSERSQVILRSRIFETEALEQTNSGANRRYIAISPTLQYELSPSWALEAGYEYQRQKRFFLTDSADSNSVFLSLVWERPTIVEPGLPESSGDLGL